MISRQNWFVICLCLFVGWLVCFLLLLSKNLCYIDERSWHRMFSLLDWFVIQKELRCLWIVFLDDCMCVCQGVCC